MKLKNSYGIFCKDLAGNTDINGYFPWKQLSALIFVKRVIQDGVAVCSPDYEEKTSHYLGESKQLVLVTPDVIYSNKVIELITYLSKSNPVFILGNEDLLLSVEHLIEKWYVVELHGKAEKSVGTELELNFDESMWKKEEIQVLRAREGRDEFNSIIYKYEPI